tara:strand:+ start:592 stop:828 length:237 start_codon:yes stop_codon:yes gene_type:complete
MISNIINIQKIRKSYGTAGPTSDNSSRVALLKKVQVKTRAGKRAQLWGLNNIKGNISGTGGDAGQKIYFSAVFPRFSF